MLFGSKVVRTMAVQMKGYARCLPKSSYLHDESRSGTGFSVHVLELSVIEFYIANFSIWEQSTAALLASEERGGMRGYISTLVPGKFTIGRVLL